MKKGFETDKDVYHCFAATKKNSNTAVVIPVQPMSSTHGRDSLRP